MAAITRRELFHLHLAGDGDVAGVHRRRPGSHRPPTVKVYGLPGAASHVTAPGEETPGPAVAFLNPDRCLPFCSVCAERCRVRGALIMQAGRARIDPARCDGCGVCVEVCPAPVPAVELLSAARPSGGGRAV